MLDTIKIGLLRLDTKKEVPGYVQLVSKSDPNAAVAKYFRIPLHVVFDLEGYNTYNQYLRKENPELKTWIHDVSINVPPNPKNAEVFPNANHEWFLLHLWEIVEQFPNFPMPMKTLIEQAVEEYKKIKMQDIPLEEEWEEESPMSLAEKIAAYHALTFYGMLQRSRFDPARLNKPGEFVIPPFVREKGEKTAKEVIEEVTETVAQNVWRNPQVSKYSETEGTGLKIKLTILFLEAFYKEKIRFIMQKLGIPERITPTIVRRNVLG